MTNYNELLNKIVSTKDKANDGVSKLLLKTDIIGNVITGRFLPNLLDINEETGEIPTDFSSYCHFVKSKIDNATIYINCLNTIGVRCPVCSKSIEMWRSTDEKIKKRSESIRRQHSFITNFYVINDLKNPDNNGKVKLLKYGKQIDGKIKSALEGELATFYGKRIYRLDGEGCTFMIKAEKNSDTKNPNQSWVTYANSTFLPASPIPNMTDEIMEQIQKNIIHITPLYNKCKTGDELMDILNKHYFINDIQEQSNAAVKEITSPFTSSEKPEVKPSGKVETIDESQLDSMIKELG
jgi:hypothetical protein